MFDDDCTPETNALLYLNDEAKYITAVRWYSILLCNCITTDSTVKVGSSPRSGRLINLYLVYSREWAVACGRLCRFSADRRSDRRSRRGKKSRRVGRAASASRRAGSPGGAASASRHAGSPGGVPGVRGGGGPPHKLSVCKGAPLCAFLLSQIDSMWLSAPLVLSIVCSGVGIT